jgi:hypothetical protein
VAAARLLIWWLGPPLVFVQVLVLEAPLVLLQVLVLEAPLVLVQDIIAL